MKHFFALLFLTSFSFGQIAAAKPHPLKNSNKQDRLREQLILELTGQDEKKTNDVELYAEIVAAYQNQDEIGLKSRLQKFMAKHPHSSFADNVLYLAGRNALDNRNYPEALKYFNRVVVDYPNSNRVVSSQFAKAMAYKKMSLNVQAKKVLNEIMSKYPGSPESFRADSEIRLLN